jgi:hypothetical protein
LTRKKHGEWIACKAPIQKHGILAQGRAAAALTTDGKNVLWGATVARLRREGSRDENKAAPDFMVTGPKNAQDQGVQILRNEAYTRTPQ